MTGILYKEFNVWLVEYETKNKNGKQVKTSIPLHTDDIAGIDDDGEYANNYNLREVTFEIILSTGDLTKARPVAKLVKPELPKIEVKRADEDEID
jgi:hypothetical protein